MQTTIVLLLEFGILTVGIGAAAMVVAMRRAPVGIETEDGLVLVASDSQSPEHSAAAASSNHQQAA